jgi:hypothetical protein
MIKLLKKNTPTAKLVPTKVPTRYECSAVETTQIAKLRLMVNPLAILTYQNSKGLHNSGLRVISSNPKLDHHNGSFFYYESPFTSGKTPIVGSIIPKSYLLFNKPSIYTLFKFLANQGAEVISKKALFFEDFSLKIKPHPDSVPDVQLSIGEQLSLVLKKRLILESIFKLNTLSAKGRSFLDFFNSTTPDLNSIEKYPPLSTYKLSLRRRLYSYSEFIIDVNLAQPYNFMNNRPQHSKYTRKSPFRGFLRQSAFVAKVRKRVKTRRLRFFKRRQLVKTLQHAPKINRFRVLSESNIFSPNTKNSLAKKKIPSFEVHRQPIVNNEYPALNLTRLTTFYAKSVESLFFTKLSNLSLCRPYLVSKVDLVVKSVLGFGAFIVKNLDNLKPTFNPSTTYSAPEYYMPIKGIAVKPLWESKLSNCFIKPRSLKHYILGGAGFFLVSRVFKPLILLTPRFNKRIYSFLFPNEVKNKLLRKKKKIKYQSAVFKLRNKLKHNRFFSYKTINKNYKSFLLVQADLKVTKLSYGFSNDNNTPVSDFKIGYKDSYDNIIDEEYFYNKGLSISFKRMEVHIPRIRFRPGYQRIWRQARSAIKESLGLKFLYQQQLTKYMMRFARKTRAYFLGENIACLDRVIIYAHLLPDMHSINTFCDQSMIHLNGRVQSNLKSLIYKNDFLQLLASVWFYVANR